MPSDSGITLNYHGEQIKTRESLRSTEYEYT